eukprot:TRINITY_DN4472_c0_g4_i1.p1 TRINITY_DN4472_c0_g4~~TRINITY_DN4472_c0_g4_i1.p1  ORF type:complete len:283 (+),score=94.06 TRINITY_DN4472_c0_g4_i1:52-849(+)
MLSVLGRLSRAGKFSFARQSMWPMETQMARTQSLFGGSWRTGKALMSTEAFLEEKAGESPDDFIDTSRVTVYRLIRSKPAAKGKLWCILKEDCDLGSKGKEIEVAKGYFRNYLYPHKMAVYATPANRRLYNCFESENVVDEDDNDLLRVGRLFYLSTEWTKKRLASGLTLNLNRTIKEGVAVQKSELVKHLHEQHKLILVEEENITAWEPIEGDDRHPLQITFSGETYNATVAISLSETIVKEVVPTRITRKMAAARSAIRAKSK